MYAKSCNRAAGQDGCCCLRIVSAPVLAQQRATVTGTVTDQSGQPVIGATVIEQGTTNGATTGVDGTYTLKLKGGGEFC